MHGRDKKNQHDKLGFFLGGGLDQGEDEQLLGIYDFCLNNYFFYNTLVLMLNECGVGRGGVQGWGIGTSACGKGKLRVPGTLDVPILSPFSVPPGPQSGRWRSMNVLPPPSALLLEGLFLLWSTFSLLFVFKNQLFQLFLSQPSKKDPGRQRRRPLGQRAEFMCDPVADGTEV